MKLRHILIAVAIAICVNQVFTLKPGTRSEDVANESPNKERDFVNSRGSRSRDAAISTTTKKPKRTSTKSPVSQFFVRECILRLKPVTARTSNGRLSKNNNKKSNRSRHQNDYDDEEDDTGASDEQDDIFLNIIINRRNYNNNGYNQQQQLKYCDTLGYGYLNDRKGKTNFKDMDDESDEVDEENESDDDNEEKEESEGGYDESDED